MLNARFLEAMNAAWFVASICLALLFAGFVKRWAKYGRTPALNAAVALLVYFTGEAMVRGWVWGWRHLLNRGSDVSWMTAAPVLFVGGGIAMLGGLCLMRVFTVSYGNLPWIVTGILAVLAGFLAAIF